MPFKNDKKFKIKKKLNLVIKSRRLVFDLILFFEKVLHVVKASGQHLGYSIFWSYFSTWSENKSKLYKCSDWLPQDMLNFDFF